MLWGKEEKEVLGKIERTLKVSLKVIYYTRLY